MDNQNQKSHATHYNRYPGIFKSAASLKTPHNRILSFGCSNGDEVRTLKDLYFPNCEIYGVDINEELIQRNQNENTHYGIHYLTVKDLMVLNQKFDIIFCMSVLCCHPPNPKFQHLPASGYSFSTFENSIVDIDKLIESGGHLIIYNSSYLFEDTVVATSSSYTKSDPIMASSGFVQKWTKNGVLIPNDEYHPLYFYCKK